MVEENCQNGEIGTCGLNIMNQTLKPVSSIAFCFGSSAMLLQCYKRKNCSFCFKYYTKYSRAPLIDTVVCVSGPPDADRLTENPLSHKSRMVTQNFREIWWSGRKFRENFGVWVLGLKILRDFRSPKIST
jgi:hypothetical protein